MEMTKHDSLAALEAALQSKDMATVMRLMAVDAISARFMIDVGNGTLDSDTVLIPHEPQSMATQPATRTKHPS